MKILKFIGKLVVAMIFAILFAGVPFFVGIGLAMEGKSGSTIWLGGGSILATAIGLAFGIWIFERMLKMERGSFQSILAWTLSGTVIGYAGGRMLTPVLITCINYMFAAGIISVVIREIVVSREEKIE